MTLGNYTFELDIYEDWSDIREWQNLGLIRLSVSTSSIDICLLGFGLTLEFYNEAKRRQFLEEFMADHPEIIFEDDDEDGRNVGPITTEDIAKAGTRPTGQREDENLRPLKGSR